MRNLTKYSACVMLSLTAVPALAHHSFAMFDAGKTVTITGTVFDYQWTNPHTWVQLMVKDPATGKMVQWSIECASPNGLQRQGWSRHSAKPGDEASITIHPLKSGSPGGEMISWSVNGQKVGVQHQGS